MTDPDLAHIRAIETLTFRGWPALETEQYDGWILRFANGYTGRANSINPLYGSTLDTDEKIAYCEAWFAERGIKAAFRLNPAMQPSDLDLRLAAKGYHLYNESRVMLTQLNDDLPTSPNDAFFESKSTISERWLTDLCSLNARHAPHTEMIRTLIERMPTPRYFASVIVDGETVAVGLGVGDRDYIGLYDIVTREDKRGRGYGRVLVSGILRGAYADGAKMAYLQVAAENTPAVKLYNGIGFRESYAYWYRAL